MSEELKPISDEELAGQIIFIRTEQWGELDADIALRAFLELQQRRAAPPAPAEVGELVERLRAQAASHFQASIHEPVDSVGEWHEKQCDLLTEAADALTRLAAHRAEVVHASDCAVHNAPALPVGPCDCGAGQDPTALRRALDSAVRYMRDAGAFMDDFPEITSALTTPDTGTGE